ncbi:hypothetical protein Tdes44962_MAKER04199 [Teratosphaeria destructans]|uniref:Uncharacterized protein n=1 Tax=Teratosphaeria destructans TaxID=418781 RepID=A0A9W7SMU8_9PEZI|nr:hypothetical protein Tdes44962_MAKER04199 [Teratosphaeria destructans]
MPCSITFTPSPVDVRLQTPTCTFRGPSTNDEPAEHVRTGPAAAQHPDGAVLTMSQLGQDAVPSVAQSLGNLAR